MRFKTDLRRRFTSIYTSTRPLAPVNDPVASLQVATYNVHRWIGLSSRRFRPDRAMAVIEELDADIVALQEVLRPMDEQDPLERITTELGFYYAFVTTRLHRKGWLGNAILSRREIKYVFGMDLTFSRLERRSAVAAQIADADGRYTLGVVNTHLALVDRTRRAQVRQLLNHPDLQGPTILLGDMNAWRRCRATRLLNAELDSLHQDGAWPRSFPSAAPILALDRIYTRGARISHLRVHRSETAREASDHLPIVATVQLFEDDKLNRGYDSTLGVTR